MTRRRDAGFTLLELVVTISVLGLLAVAVARGLRLGSDGWTRAHVRTDSAARLRDGRRLLQDLLAGASPQFATGGQDDRRIFFAGGAEQIEMITRLPQALGTPAMVAARIFRSDQGVLTLGWRLYLPRSDGGGPLQEQFAPIAAHVSAVGFTYFGTPAGGGAAVWQPEWSDRTALPQLIRVFVQDDDERHGTWPVLTVDVRASAVSACQYDSTDLECRRY